VAFGAVVALVLALLAPAVVDAPAVERSVLTSDGPAYRYRYDGHRLGVRATGSGEPNRREVVVPAGARRGRDQITCATWARQSSWRVQPGLAVRVVDRAGRVRAVTLTKNIVWGVQTVMNVLTWDTDRRGRPWRTVAQFDLARVLLTPHRRLVPLPWRACLRVQDRRVSVKVWPLGRVDRPAWSDRAHVRHARLPRAFRYAGRPGWYVGHVPDGGSLAYRGLRVGR
jgi:hypothetical protein